MSFDSNRVKHLEFIQDVITRMNRCSFLLKGWSVTLVSALFALSTKNLSYDFSAIALFPALAFWLLDAFYLDQERRFRALYKAVITSPEDVPLFDMRTSLVEGSEGNFWSAFWSTTVALYHGAVVAAIGVVMMVLRCSGG